MEASQSLLLNAASHTPSTTQVPEETQIAVKNGLEEKMKKNFSQIWIPVTLHVACCFGLCFTIVYALDGFKTISDDLEWGENGSLQLRPRDFNTLISLATSIIAFLVDSYAGIAVWTCAFTLLRTTGLTSKQLDSVVDAPSQLSWIIWDGWPARWIRQGKIGRFAALALLFLFPQAFIDLVITGAVDWKASVVLGPEFSVQTTDPRADISNWFLYLNQNTARKALLRVAGGNAAIGWADTGNFTHLRRSSSLRTIVNDDRLLINSTIKYITLPALMVHSITWDDYQVSLDVYDITQSSEKVSVVDDAPFSYYHGGNAIVFDPQDPEWTSRTKYIDSNTTWAIRPPPSRFSGNKKVVLKLARQKTTTPACSPVIPQTFRDLGSGKNVFPLEEDKYQNCFISGTIKMTAGVVKKKLARYVNSRVVEYEGAPWSVDDIQSDRWVEEAIRLLPDVMAFVSQVNASSIPTWENIDEYVESLVQQSFMGAWSALHRTNDVGNVTLQACSGIVRSQAVVSRTRAFFWLGGTLLLPVSAIIVTYFQRQYLDRASLSAVNSRAATLLSRLEADEDGVLHIRTPFLSSHSAAEEKGGLET